MVEFSVVGVVVAIITVMIVPRFAQADDRSRVTATVQDLLGMTRTFELFKSSHGYWPPDTRVGQMPPEMRSVFGEANPFAKPCPIGGVYDYDNHPSDRTIRISIRATYDTPAPSIADAQALDAELDDGVLSTGNFRAMDDGSFAYAFSRK